MNVTPHKRIETTEQILLKHLVIVGDIIRVKLEIPSLVHTRTQLSHKFSQFKISLKNVNSTELEANIHY